MTPDSKSGNHMVSINLVNLYLRLGFINERIKTHSSTTGVVSGIKKVLSGDKNKSNPKK